MEAIRKIIQTSSTNLNIDLPEEYKNKKIEVIILPLEEEKDEALNLSDFFGKLEWQGDALAEQKRIRDEWH